MQPSARYAAAARPCRPALARLQMSSLGRCIAWNFSMRGGRGARHGGVHRCGGRAACARLSGPIRCTSPQPFVAVQRNLRRFVSFKPGFGFAKTILVLAAQNGVSRG
jgi:hypothetical protein